MGKKIIFKNGTELEVGQDVADILRDRILEGSPKPFQCFSDQNNKTQSIINISEIVCIA